MRIILLLFGRNIILIEQLICSLHKLCTLFRDDVGLPGRGRNSVSCDVNPESCEEIDESRIGPKAYGWLG